MLQAVRRSARASTRRLSEPPLCYDGAMELVLCGGCRRHVDSRETTCPFCAAAVTARPQRAFLRGRLSRAAVFSAALVACESKQSPPAPAPVPQQQGSDDLETMLDGDQHVADQARVPVAPTTPTDASLADAGAIETATADAGVPADAGMDRAKILELKLEKDRRRREKRRKKMEEQLVQPPPYDQINIPKPYGAPPARRRLV